VNRNRRLPALAMIIGCAALTVAGCAFQGLNSLPLPGTVGRGAGAQIFHVEVLNAGALEANSPVMMNDVVVGSVAKMTFRNWHADIEVSIAPNVVVPANVVPNVGQTSLLGTMHVELGLPQGQSPAGRLRSGATIRSTSSTYPSTEQTLTALSAVVNGGGLGQIGDIIHTLSAGFSGRAPQARDLLARLDRFIGTLDSQRDNILASIDALNRVAGTFAAQRDVINHALKTIPPALDVLIRERPRITAALHELGVFSDTAKRLVDETKNDLVTNLRNLEPTLKSLADVGPGLDTALAFVSVFPFGQDAIDRQVKGDYINLSVILDLTLPRLKRSLLLGTRWQEPGALLVAAPGEPYYLNYSYDPMSFGVKPPGAPKPPGGGAPPPAWAGPPAPTSKSAAIVPDTSSTIAPVDQPDSAPPRGGH
jgi:phospholipid/cholesterol/gamma-HCH transport system substrate-binding protein